MTVFARPGSWPSPGVHKPGGGASRRSPLLHGLPSSGLLRFQVPRLGRLPAWRTPACHRSRSRAPTAKATAPQGGAEGASPGELWQQLITSAGLLAGLCLTSAAAALSSLLPVWVLGAAALGLARPAAFCWFQPGLATTSLAATMLAMGLTISFEDVKRVLSTPRRIATGVVVQYTLGPALALLVSRVLGLPWPYSLGLCLVGCCPSGSAASVVAHLSKADVALSAALTLASAVGALVAMPAFSQLALGTHVAVDLPSLLISSLQVVLLPMLAGAAIAEAFPSAVALLRPLCTLCAAGLSVAIAGSNLAYSSRAVARAGPQLLVAVVAVHAGSFLLGRAAARALGLPERAARTAAIHSSMRNSTLGALLVSFYFPAYPLAALPCALSACTQSVMGPLLAAAWRAQALGEAHRGGARPAGPAGSEPHQQRVRQLGAVLRGLGGRAAAAAAPPLGALRAGLRGLLLAAAQALAVPEAVKVELLLPDPGPRKQRGPGQGEPSPDPAPQGPLGHHHRQQQQSQQQQQQQYQEQQTGAEAAAAGNESSFKFGSILDPVVDAFKQPVDVLMPDLSSLPLIFETVQAPPPPPPPPANPNALSLVMVGAECAPWSKTGGLGDVMQALPKALAARGHRVMVVVPRYQNYDEAWETGVRLRLRCFGSDQEIGYFHSYLNGVDYVFVDHPAYHRLGREIYSGPAHDIMFRCALLCKAALEAPWRVPCGGAPYGENNLLFVANDWHTALLPVYLQAHYQDYRHLTQARSLLVLHNVAHQGRAQLGDLRLLEIPDQYADLFRLFDPQGGGEHMNIMKAGVITAHRVVAVSQRYAWECQTEEHGWGLDGVLREQSWKLSGVVNGIDLNEWHPAIDPHLRGDGYANYDINSVVHGKSRCKAALQRELGLPVDPDAPLLGFIGRLDFQKGVDLICESFPWIMEQGAQLVLLGSGRQDLEEALRDMERRCPRQCRGWVGFSVKLAHRITAGADILLMPSRFEPCGLNQLYAMAYGTTPVVHAVGGLADTVAPFDPYGNTGTGWTFHRAEAGAFQKAMGDAIFTYRHHRASFRGVQQRGMLQDLSWDNAAKQYEDVLLAAKQQ